MASAAAGMLVVYNQSPAFEGGWGWCALTMPVCSRVVVKIFKGEDAPNRDRKFNHRIYIEYWLYIVVYIKSIGN